jgi:hypothetical protein
MLSAEMTRLSKWASAGTSEFARFSQALDAWQKSPLADDITRTMRDLPVGMAEASKPSCCASGSSAACGRAGAEAAGSL